MNILTYLSLGLLLTSRKPFERQKKAVAPGVALVAMTTVTLAWPLFALASIYNTMRTLTDEQDD